MGAVVGCPRCGSKMAKGSITSPEVVWRRDGREESEPIGGKRHDHLGVTVDGQRFNALKCGRCKVITFVFPKN
jgi:hypothetical protein